jgi:hypothetical protein
LDEAFTKLNNQLKEKDARIVALESKLDLKEREFLLKSDESESDESNESESDESDESESWGVKPVESWGAKPVESDEIKTHINNLLTNRFTKCVTGSPTMNHTYNNDEEEE